MSPTRTLKYSPARKRYAALAVGTIVLGLAIHSPIIWLPHVTRDVVGDALWAMMIVWWLSSLAPNSSLRGRATCSVAVCFAVELSQLIQTPWMNSLRDLPGGRLVLGSGFDPRDLVAYTSGVLLAMLLESMWRLQADTVNVDN